MIVARALARLPGRALPCLALLLSAACGGGGGGGGSSATTVTVTPSAVDVAVAPDSPQAVAAGGVQVFVVTAQAHHAVSQIVGGTCPAGSWSGSTYSTGPVTADCTVQFAGADVPWNVAVATDAGLVAPSPGTQVVLDGDRAVFTVAVGARHVISRTVGGDCPGGSWTGDVYETGPITGACTVSFASVPLHAVTASATGATVSPAATQLVASGDVQAFVVTAEVHRVVSRTVGGTCPAGTWSGGTYTTGAVVADCDVQFATDPALWSVAVATDAGVAAPSSGTQLILDGDRAVFTVAASARHVISRTVGGDCPGGSWTGDVYETGPITGACTVSFASVALHTVTPGALDVTVSPATAQTVVSGGVQAFTVTPPPYHLVSHGVAGTCAEGAWSGDTYTTGPVTADCDVTFSVGCEHCGGTCVSYGTPPVPLAVPANLEICSSPCAVQPSVTPVCGTCASACGLGESCVNGACRCLQGSYTCRPTRQPPACTSSRGTSTCPFLAADLSQVELRYATVEVNAAADADTWIHVDGRSLFPGGDGISYAYVMSCQEGHGQLRYPSGSQQAAWFDANGVISDLARLEAYTTTTRACRTFDAGPIISFGSSSSFPNGYLVRFTPNAGESGYGYQVMSVAFVDAELANTSMVVVDYVIDVLPDPAAVLTVSAAAFGGLAVTPSGDLPFARGATPSFTVTGGESIVRGTCPRGMWSGTRYTIGEPLRASCTVEFRPEVPVYESHANGVTVTPGGGGSVPYGGTLSYIATFGGTLAVAGTCPAGSWKGTIYTTGPITEFCTVQFLAAAGCAGATSCAAAFDAEAASTWVSSPAYGGPGGVAFGPDVCAAGHALVGLRGGHDGNVGWLAGECGFVAKAVSGGVTTVFADTSAPTAMATHGTGSSTPFTLRCPADSVVTRVDGYADAVAPNGTVTTGLHALSVWCSPLSWSGSAVAVGAPALVGSAASSWDMSASTPFSFACPAGTAMGALEGRAGIWIDAVGFRCYPFLP